MDFQKRFPNTHQFYIYFAFDAIKKISDKKCSEINVNLIQ